MAKLTQSLLGKPRTPAQKKAVQEGIQSAIKRPGALSAKAKAKGMSTQAFASGVKSGSIKSSPLTKKQSMFFLNFLAGGRK